MITDRAEKVARLVDIIPDQDVFGSEEGDLLVLSWGGTYGAARSAVKRAQRKGQSVSHAHIRYLNPFPKNLPSLLKGYNRVLVTELNAGQLAFVIRGKFLIDVIPFPKLHARPFRIDEIESKIQELLG
jgi:2-oxoglutarate ferredoxin oxidoreductase subunit alpha